MANEKILKIDEGNFQAEVADSNLPVLVDFWAPWCGPCRQVAPVLDELAKEMDTKVRIAKVNVDENQALAAQYQVASIPTFLVFKNGEIAGRMMGARPKAHMQQFIETSIG